VKWSGDLESTFLSILVDILVNTFNKSILKSLFDFILSPWVKLLGDNWATTGSLDGIQSLLLLLSIVNQFLNMVSIL